MSRVVELFAGSGGVSQGMAMLGIPTIGIEFNPDAAATAVAAGHHRIVADVSDLDPLDFGPAWGFHASPPCQAWSRAGKQKGQLDKDNVMALLDDYAHGRGLDAHHSQYEWHDERSHLAAEPMRWIVQLRPEWITMEEVPSVLPVWERYVEHLRALGYSAWCGTVTAEQFGVPQTRRRAMLVANRTFEVAPMQPTHRKWRKGDEQSAGDPSLRPWVSMVDALGWGMTRRPSMVVTSGGAGTGGAEPFGNEARLRMQLEQEEGRWALRNNTSANAAVRNEEEPAPTLYFGERLNKMTWEFEQPWTPEDRVGFARAADELGPATEDGYRERDFRTADQPSLAVTSKMRSALRQGPMKRATVRDIEEPAGTVFFGKDPAMTQWIEAAPGEVAMRGSGRVGQSEDRDPFTEPASTITGAGSAMWTIPEDRLAIQSEEYEIDRSWPAERPSTAVAGRGLVQHPGATANRFNGSTKTRNDGVRITVAEASVLQTMPPDYPYQGSQTRKFQSIGDLVPARLAAYAVGAALGVTDYVGYIDRHYLAGAPWGAR